MSTNGGYSTAGTQSSWQAAPNQQASLTPEPTWSPLRQRTPQPTGQSEMQQNLHVQQVQQPHQTQQQLPSQQQLQHLQLQQGQQTQQAQYAQQQHQQGSWQRYLQPSASSWSFSFQPEAMASAAGFTHPAGWQCPAQLKWNADSLKALRNRSILSESVPALGYQLPVTYQVLEDAGPKMHSSKDGQPTEARRSSQHRGTDQLSPNRHASAGVRQAAPDPMVPGRGFAPSPGRNTQRPASADRGGNDRNNPLSLAGLKAHIEASLEAIHSSIQQVWMGTMTGPTSVFSSCTKVPGQPSARFVQGAPSDFSLGCEHIEPCLARVASRDELFQPSRDPPRPPSRPLPTSWFAKTSPPLKADGQSGGVPSSVTGFRDNEPQSIDIAAAQTKECSCQRPMSASEVRDALAANCTSICSLKGNKQTAANQDRASCASLQSGAAELLAVFDGHGEFGHLVAERSDEILPKLLFQALAKAGPRGLGGQGSPNKQSGSQNPQDAGEAAVEWPEAACHAFTETHEIFEALTREAVGSSGGANADNAYALDARASGTTATMVLLLPNRKALIAHVGDSRAVLGTRPRNNPRAQWHTVNLTRDHKPELPDEQARIEKAGAQIISSGNGVSRIFTPQQHWPMINMTRSIGDLHAHSQGLIADAEVRVVEQLWDPSAEDAVLVICSDGVWDVMDSLAVVEFVTEPHAVGMEPAMALAHEAHVRWARRGLANGYVDDITAVVKFL